MLEQPSLEGPGHLEESKAPDDCDQDSPRSLLKAFLLDQGRKSVQFAHLVFGYLLADIDDSESIQMSQHNNREQWAFFE